MKQNTHTVTQEYNRIAALQRNNGLTVDHVAICNVVAAMQGYRFQDVLDIMEGRG